MIDAGVYLAIFRLPRPLTIHIRTLGCFDLPAGVYLYVGSAQKNLQTRLARHARRRKRRHWHIDHLSCHAPMLGALILEGPKSLECRVAKMLAHRYECLVPDFGSSDCRCGGHLFQYR